MTAGGRRLLTAPTPEAAEELRALLAGGGAASADLDAARALRRRLRPFRIALRGLALLLAAFLVAGAAAAGGWSLPVGPLAAACGATLLAIGVAGGAYLRSAGEGWSRSVAGGLGVLLPWAALHPLVHLSRPLFRRFDAMTAAAALLEPEAFRELAARELVRARLSRRATPGELAGAWDERERHLARLLQATGSSPEAALAPPRGADGAAAYCPLCRTRYRPGFTICADCGAGLEPLPADATAAARTPPTAP